MGRKLKYESVTELELELKSHNLVFSSSKLCLSSSEYTCIPIQEKKEKLDLLEKQ